MDGWAVVVYTCGREQVAFMKKIRKKCLTCHRSLSMQLFKKQFRTDCIFSPLLSNVCQVFALPPWHPLCTLATCIMGELDAVPLQPSKTKRVKGTRKH